MDPQPLVSIIIPCYNYGRYLPAAIDSALAQSHPRCEVIVVDDGSTDDSRQVALAYGSRIKTVFKENGGLPSSYNAGFAASSGELVCFLDADDYFLPEKVAVIAAAYAANPQAQWCFHRMRRAGQDGSPRGFTPSNPEGAADLRAGMRRGAVMPLGTSTSGLTFRREHLACILPMPVPADHGSAFDDNYLKLASYALAPGLFLNRPLTVQVIHGENAFTANPASWVPRTKRTLLAAYYLRWNYPETARYAHKQLAKAIAYGWHARWLEEPYRSLLAEYLAATPLAQRAMIHLLAVVYYVTKNRTR